MYFGRYENGQEVRLHVQCRDTTGQQVAPSNIPHLDIFSNGSKIAANVPMFPEDTKVTGLFVCPYFLQSFSPGTCQVVFRWPVGFTTSLVAVGYFEVVPGGNDDGAVISMFYFETPQGRYLLQQTDAGIIKQGKNPQ